MCIEYVHLCIYLQYSFGIPIIPILPYPSTSLIVSWGLYSVLYPKVSCARQPTSAYNDLNPCDNRTDWTWSIEEPAIMGMQSLEFFDQALPVGQGVGSDDHEIDGAANAINRGPLEAGCDATNEPLR